MTASTFADSTAETEVATAPLPGRSRTPADEFVRYLAASACALAIDSSLFLGLTATGLPWAISAAAGFVAGLLVAYTLSLRLVFVHRAVPDAQREFLIFTAVGVVGLMLTEALLWLLLERLRLPPAAAKLTAAACVFLSNFGLRKALLFTDRGPAG